ncbi:MAG TPA: TlpA disulfide reductase family protein, partial [Bryobacteraceae bacterium]|nr:TlpA disulfide reductase family protein [Bryobacteraceae bacterium]
KAVLINLWATWCGPCRAELPHFQKLYEQTKDRSDVQVISFNVDQEAGLVDPYMKENSYSFPALMAFGIVREMFDGYGIPQNWLIDSKGNWIATQIGFDASDTDWVGSMLKRLDAAKTGKAPAGTE